jgi:NAD(P)-dependent dehydrogenase (short-subunit alcohol dehydrogenase family)
MRLRNKTALVTAAGQGMGRASALALAEEGAEVWATDVDARLLESYAGVANVRTARLDVLDAKAIDTFVAGSRRSTSSSTSPGGSTTAACSTPARPISRPPSPSTCGPSSA